MTHVNQSTAQSLSYRPPKNTFLDKLTKKEKIWGVIGILFLMGSINDGMPLFFPLIILIFIVHGVSQRDKAKIRIVRILNQTPETNVSYLASQLDKSENYVTEVLKIMILDEGAPIRFDLVQKTVKKVGGLSVETEVYSEPVRSISVSDTVRQTVAPTVVEERTTKRVEESVQLENQCIQCEEPLPPKVKFCHNCGVRQYA